jgi:hypothetical protein
MAQLDLEDRRLHRVEARIEAHARVDVLDGRSPVPQQADLLRQRVVVRGDRAAVAVGAEVFSRIETEASGDTHRSAPPSLVGGAVRLRRVLDDVQFAIARHRQQRIHVGRLAVEVNRHQHLGSTGERR